MTIDYHFDGYRPGDPRDLSSQSGRAPSDELPATADIVIVGCGPAGLTLAAQLAQFPELHTVIIDQKHGPLKVGQADGISGRSLEIFEAFGFSNRVMEEAYQLRAISFWRHDATEPERIARTDKKEDGRGRFSHFPHVVLNQARVHDFLLETMSKGPAGISPHYGLSFQSMELDTELAGKQPRRVTVHLEGDGESGGIRKTINTRYLVGCDGARSAVRQAMGIKLEGDSRSRLWGVMDLLLVTDFPDIRVKTVVESAREGTLMIIPREGGHLVRFYVELGELAPNERIKDRNITLEELVATAERILRPYTLSVREVPWWSVYEVGQRLCPVFDNRDTDGGEQHPSVFIVGDACHTHSPKAGQGMNISMHDSFNLGWKLAAVARGKCVPELLRSYSDERHAIAQELIDFDREFAEAFSADNGCTDESMGSRLQEALLKADGFVSGTMSQYQSLPTVQRDSAQWLATGLEIGKRFPSVPVLRAVDACPLRLSEQLRADGRWRVLLVDRESAESGLSPELRQLLDRLENSPTSPLGITPSTTRDADSAIEVLAVLPRDFRSIEFAQLPTLLWPPRGKLGLRDYGKVFCPGIETNDWYAGIGADIKQGCVAIIRPDQHIAAISALTEPDAVAQFFANLLT